jgi:hypothetical protein
MSKDAARKEWYCIINKGILAKEDGWLHHMTHFNKTLHDHDYIVLVYCRMRISQNSFLCSFAKTAWKWAQEACSHSPEGSETTEYILPGAAVRQALPHTAAVVLVNIVMGHFICPPSYEALPNTQRDSLTKSAIVVSFI